ncbi:hypothetical protein [Stutzerimonas kunmingensis]|uniref:hypothetical protein n=1 Tax=Stutzerimonas kunmingensis TaxID=1211807 RepID=UPI00241C78A0|nr:hypothetical protein [Stutzerimonas kunmingensis]
MEDFQQALKTHIGDCSTLRPFVCEGSPLDCKVFIVGFNPASNMDAGFWDFWRAGYGFDKAAWFDVYRYERRVKPLSPGKKRRTAVSRTRRIIELIVAGAAPFKCLETNIYSLPTESAKQLAAADRDSAVFEFLLERVNPQLIVAHGRDAQDYLREKRPAAPVIEVRHFSARGKDKPWTNAEACELGYEIKRRLG